MGQNKTFSWQEISSAVNFFLFVFGFREHRKRMGACTFAGILLIAHLMLLEETSGLDTISKSRFTGLDRRLARFPISELLLERKADNLGKRQEQFDDYGHMRFGKRGEESDDYGHMRFGKRD